MSMPREFYKKYPGIGSVLDDAVVSALNRDSLTDALQSIVDSVQTSYPSLPQSDLFHVYQSAAGELQRRNSNAIDFPSVPLPASYELSFPGEEPTETLELSPGRSSTQSVGREPEKAAETVTSLFRAPGYYKAYLAKLPRALSESWPTAMFKRLLNHSYVWIPWYVIQPTTFVPEESRLLDPKRYLKAWVVTSAHTTFKIGNQYGAADGERVEVRCTFTSSGMTDVCVVVFSFANPVNWTQPVTRIIVEGVLIDAANLLRDWIVDLRSDDQIFKPLEDSGPPRPGKYPGVW